MNQELDDQMCMSLARTAAERSYDKTHKVGCVIVTPDHMMTLGWNGMPMGMDNDMEYPTLTRHACGCLYMKMRTRPEVQHAELNALGKFAGSTASAAGATLYVTLSPCLNCAILLYRAKIARVLYAESFHNQAGIEFLSARGLEVRRI